MSNTSRPTPATEPVPFMQADPKPQGYAIPSPEETAAHRATDRADDPAAADIHPAVREAQTSVVRAQQQAADRAARIDQERANDVPPTVPTRLRVISFGYLHRPAPTADLTLDLRQLLSDPYHVLPVAMRDDTGLDRHIADFVWRTPGAGQLLDDVVETIRGLLAIKDVTFAVGCKGGKHRAAAFAAALAAAIEATHPGRVTVEHWDVEKDRVTTKTPAMQQAALLETISAHLRQHPHLPTFHLGPEGALQNANWGDPRSDARCLLDWADTLQDPHITADRWATDRDGKNVAIYVTAKLNGIQIQVWDVLDASAQLGLKPDQKRDLTVEELRDLAAEVTG